MSDRIECAAFDEGVGELALELLDPHERDALMEHAAGCNRCRGELESMASVADLVVTVAPTGEPSVGFEQRALEAMTGSSGASTATGSRRILAIAAALLLVGVGGAVLGRATVADDSRSAALDRVGVETARGAPLLDAGGTKRGSVLLTDGSGLLLTMSLEGLDIGTYHCVVKGVDGTSIEVAAWPIGPSGAGSWVVPLDRPLASIDQVLVTEDDGSTAAIADLG